MPYLCGGKVINEGKIPGSIVDKVIEEEEIIYLIKGTMPAKQTQKIYKIVCQVDADEMAAPPDYQVETVVSEELYNTYTLGSSVWINYYDIADKLNDTSIERKYVWDKTVR